ncbi:MAG: alkaline phosphatase D family protein [Gammaproteobacteria bacterium]|nr:alkaline phosphatase D family protein [Gammaproteobacteria bacterium]
MAITDWWLGHATTTTARVVLRTDTNGTPSVTCNGDTFTGSAISTATNDGVGVVDITGLSAGKRTAFTLTIGAESVTGHVKTFPETGSIKIGIIGCCVMQRHNPAIEELYAKGIDALYTIGDMPYCEDLTNANGITCSPGSSVPTLANMEAINRANHNNIQLKRISQNIPLYKMWDDHELFGDDWDHTVASCNDVSAIATDTADVADFFEICQKAWSAYAQGNPSNSDAEATPTKPNSSPDGDATRYPVQYFRHTLGAAEIFVTDSISHKTENTATDNASKTMYGSAQKAWFKKYVSESSKDFKIAIDSKSLFRNTGSPKGDSWNKFTTERNEIWDQILNTDGTTGVLHIGSDDHVAIVSKATTAVEGWDLVSICTGSGGTEHASIAITGPVLGQWGHLSDIQGNTGAIVEITSDYLQISIINGVGSTLFQKRILSGSNDLSGVT